MSLSRTVRMLRTLAVPILFTATVQAGSITVTSSVTSAGTEFTYNYSIANGTTNDLFDLDIAVSPGVDITDLTAPSGFQTAYDSGLGLVSFLEDTATFSATPTTGFSFESTVGPGSTAFTANLEDLTTFASSTVTGAAQGPVVPEPSSLALSIVSGAAALIILRKRSPSSRSAQLSNSLQQGPK